VTPDLTVDLTSPTPPFEQIRAQIAGYVRAGVLADGTRLPTMRALAADLGVAIGTVARAYAELEAAGLVASRRRTGTVVTARPPTTGAGEEAVHRSAARLVEQSRAAGMDGDTLLAVVRAALSIPDADRRRPSPGW
jgi:GntR family transcriptional regulator